MWNTLLIIVTLFTKHFFVRSRPHCPVCEDVNNAWSIHCIIISVGHLPKYVVSFLNPFKTKNLLIKKKVSIVLKNNPHIETLNKKKFKIYY
jgi:hypothetical protein